MHSGYGGSRVVSGVRLIIVETSLPSAEFALEIAREANEDSRRPTPTGPVEAEPNSDCGPSCVRTADGDGRATGDVEVSGPCHARLVATLGHAVLGGVRGCVLVFDLLTWTMGLANGSRLCSELNIASYHVCHLHMFLDFQGASCDAHLPPKASSASAIIPFKRVMQNDKTRRLVNALICDMIALPNESGLTMLSISAHLRDCSPLATKRLSSH